MGTLSPVSRVRNVSAVAVTMISRLGRRRRQVRAGVRQVSDPLAFALVRISRRLFVVKVRLTVLVTVRRLVWGVFLTVVMVVVRTLLSREGILVGHWMLLSYYFGCCFVWLLDNNLIILLRRWF